MKISIIGAGNMGGAIARGLLQGTQIVAKDLTVTDPDRNKLEELQMLHPDIRIACDNQRAVADADIIIVAVKPWLAKEVLTGIRIDPDKQMIVSIVAGIPFSEYMNWLGQPVTLFRVIPNTAISELASTTLIASYNATKEQESIILDLFNEMGLAMLIPEKQMAAGTALSSCGIAYVLKYIQAGMQAGIEMGFYPKDAMRIVAQSVKGAAELILNNDTHPSVEIDKVTTPGGNTIKGINELDHAGFTSAVIRAIKKSSE